MKVLVAIPCFNEGLTIGSLVLKARLYADEVLVIDDGSKDRTAEIASLAGATVITHTGQLGKGAGVRDAMNYARDGGYRALVLIDGDGQHNPDEIPAVVAPILSGRADLVIGSRFLETDYDIPLYRRFGQIVLNIFTNVSSDYHSTDSQSGFRALSQRALEDLDLKSDGYNVESDMLSSFSASGYTITEVPISVKYEVPHKHKKNPLTHGFGVLTNIIGTIGTRKPLTAFGTPGILIALVGLIISTWGAYRYTQTMQVPFFTISIGALLTLTGLLLITSGLILHSLISLIRAQN